MVKIKKTMLYLSYLLLIIGGFFLVYILSAFVLSRIAVEKAATAEEENISCYILTNGVHTDLVVPIHSDIKDWRTFVSTDHTISKNTHYTYVAFGWGDKGFYLATPTWADLTLKTAIKAGFGLSSTAMHTTFYTSMITSEVCKELKLSRTQYLLLVSYIENSFDTETGVAKLIDTDVRYNNHDVFYEAKGTYSLFKTCNTWANNGLKVCGQKAAFWTPFDSGIFYHYK